MKIQLTHPFLFLCKNRKELLDDCLKLNTFLGRLEKQSDLKNVLDKNKYKGDGFELFVEALIKLSPIDKRVGILNYKLITEGDTGVDGSGIGINGHPATVQCKYRQYDHVLTANKDHLANFVMTSQNKFKVKVGDKDNMLIVTSGKALHHYTHVEMFDGQVRTLHREALRKLVDNNLMFWQSFQLLWQEAIEENI